MNHPRLSLIICSHNRADQLSACLDALPSDAMRARDVELILVDNASTDGTPDVMRRFAERCSLDVRIVTEPNTGLSNARNAGILASRASLLAFTDDDCYLDDGFIDAVLHRFDHDTLAFAGGRIHLHDPTDAMYTVNYDDRPRAFRPHRMMRPGDVQGACMIVRRSVVETVGMFDPNLGAGTPFRFEDIDLVGRAACAGFTGAHCPELIVFHHHGRKPGDDIDALRDANAVARGGYYAKFILAGHVLMLLAWMMAHVPRPRLKDLRGEMRGAFAWIRAASTTRQHATPLLKRRGSD